MTPEDTPTTAAGEDQADNPPGDVTAVGPATDAGPDPAELDPELGISAERPALDPDAGPQDGPHADL